MILQEPYIRYISRISDAVQSISEGNLNTKVDVTGTTSCPAWRLI